MRIDVISIRELDTALASTWGALLDSEPSLASPFFTPGFAKAIGRHRDDLFLGIIEDAGEITGLLPFHRRPGGCGAPVGGHLSDYQGIVGAAPPAAATAELLRGLGLGAFDFNHALAGQPLFAANAFTTAESPRADLGKGYAAWEQEVSGQTSTLKTLARKERKMEREMGPLRFVRHDSSDAAWADFRRWKDEALRQLGNAFLDASWEVPLFEDMRHCAETGFAGRFSTLYAGDRLVAAHFGICSGRAWHWWFPTYDASLPNYSHGLILLRHCIAAAAEEGLTEFDFGRGDQDYKLKLSNRMRPLCEGSLERVATPRGALRRARKLVQRRANAWLPERHADLVRRAGNRLVTVVRL